jgi:hypothetical protein
MSKWKLLSAQEIEALLKKLPNEVKLDILSFGLDLMGLVNPAADAASAALSLWRGDFFGAAISAISIIPVGDVLKIGKLGKYAKTVETLVTKVVPTNPALYKELMPLMEQFRSMLAKIPAGNKEIEAIRDQVNRFFKNAELHRLSAGAKTIADWASFAKNRGKWKNPAFAKSGTSPSAVVDQLLNAAEHGNTSLKMNAKEMIEQMGQRDWVISAGPHATTATAGKHLDTTPHITLEINGAPNPFHVRLDGKGHIFEIRTVVNKKATNVVPGTPRGWQGPGQ